MKVSGNGWKKQLSGDARHGRAKWRLYCTVEVDGKRRQKSCTVENMSEKAAEKALREWVDGLRDAPADGTMTLREWARKWCEWRESLGRWSAKTNESARDSLRLLCREPIGGKQLADITRADCVETLARMRRERGWSAGTAALHQSKLSTCFARAVALGHMHANPLAGEPYPSGEVEHPRRVVPPAAMDRVRDALAAEELDGFTMAMWLIVELGLRREEAVYLLDADVHETSVHVSRSKTRAGTGRLLPLNARLTALCALWRSLKERMGVESPYFVCHWDGSPITPRMMYDWWRKRRMRLCGADWNLHEFRHTLATNMGAAGVSAVVLMQVMGWSSPAMAAVYCHEERDAISAAFGRLSDGR